MKKTRHRNKNTLFFLSITIAGVLIRYLWIIKVPNHPVSDFDGYYRIAKNIFHHLGVSVNGKDPVAFQGPAYPIVLACFFKLAGSTEILTAKLLNLMISTATMLVSFFIFKKLFKTTRLVFTAYIGITLLPNYIAYNSVLSTEILFTFFMCVTILLQVSDCDKRIRYPLMGFFAALTALTKPFFIVYPVLLMAAEWLRKKSLKQTAIAGLAVLLFMVITIAPWTYRNYRNFHMFIPISYNSGYVLFVNNNSSNWYGGWMNPKDMQVSDEFKQQFADRGIRYPDHPAQVDKLFKREAQRWMITHPIQFAELGFLRVKNTFFNGAQDIGKWTMNGLRDKWTKGGKTLVNTERDISFFLAVSDVIVYVLSSLGLLYVLLNLLPIIKTFFKSKATTPYGTAVVVLNIAFFAAVYFVSEGQARYNYPALFFLIISAVHCLGMLHAGWRQYKQHGI